MISLYVHFLCTMLCDSSDIASGMPARVVPFSIRSVAFLHWLNSGLSGGWHHSAVCFSFSTHPPNFLFDSRSFVCFGSEEVGTGSFLEAMPFRTVCRLPVCAPLFPSTLVSKSIQNKLIAANSSCADSPLTPGFQQSSDKKLKLH